MDDNSNKAIQQAIQAAKQGQPLNECLPDTTDRTKLVDVQSYLSPAPARDVATGLASILVLCAPAGFSEEDREIWLQIATETVMDLPAELLHEAIVEARKVCDHPSKIVPFINEFARGGNPAKRKTYISSTGYVYRSKDPEQVMREAEQRADWSTYYQAKVDLGGTAQ